MKFKKKELLESISPILIDHKSGSLTISLSKRFLFSRMTNSLLRKIESDPYLNFISLLKNYKLLGKILTGTIGELHRDRNRLYFKNFFMDIELYEAVKADIEWVYKKNQNINVTITKRGIIIYDNYQKNNFNVLLMTIHSGTFIPKKIMAKQEVVKSKRILEEDIDTHKIYGNLVLEKGGIWIDNKFSRFACDYNRSSEKAIYENGSLKRIKKIWSGELTNSERKELMKGYAEFYFTLGHLIDSYMFNIIFDAHSMKNAKGRPEISFGTEYIPTFYMPIVRSMQKKLSNLGYSPVALNNPFKGGYILDWLSQRFPHRFIFSMEVNKKLYMNRNMKKTSMKKLKKLSEDINHIFDIEEIFID